MGLRLFQKTPPSLFSPLTPTPFFGPQKVVVEAEAEADAEMEAEAEAEAEEEEENDARRFNDATRKPPCCNRGIFGGLG